MKLGNRAIVWFEEIGKKDIPLVGGKGANLGELTNAGIPVPPGFIVTANAYFDFLEKTQVTDRVRSILAPVDVNDSRKLQQAAKEAQQVILDARMPQELVAEIEAAYRKMGDGLVAVRSSATAEDLPEASFAGQQSTFLNLQGEKEVVEAVQGCWASLFEARAIFYREQQEFDHFKVGIAVPVQSMVQSEASGVMFTIEPVTSDQTRSLSKPSTVWAKPSFPARSPRTFISLTRRGSPSSPRSYAAGPEAGAQPHGGGKDPNIWLAVPPQEQGRQKMSDADIIKLAWIGRQIEYHYDFPQDIEWAKEGKNLYRADPSGHHHQEKTEVEPEITAPVLLSGAAASPGLASGPVKIIPDPTQIDLVKDGDILVAEMTTPDFVPAMKRAVAIVTDRGGRTSHAAIVSRELGIPCVVGAEGATTSLVTGQVITVDGSHGKVYDGKVTRHIETSSMSGMLREIIKTKTRVYVNLAQPELADRVASRNVDGVGLLRAEFIVAQIGEHPSYMMSQNRGDEFIEKLTRASPPSPRPSTPARWSTAPPTSRPTSTAP